MARLKRLIKSSPNEINTGVYIVKNTSFSKEFLKKWAFDELYDYICIKLFKNLGLFFGKIIDIKIIDKFGPDGLSSLIKYFSLKASNFQSGHIYQYAFVMLLGFSVFLTYIIIN